jgi:hypothetical protein
MHKRKLHHLWVRLRPISYWYFIVLFVVSGGMALLALRHNNLQAIELRDKVLQADEQNGDVEASLRELREFTYTHMHAGLANDNGIYPPIQLKYRYERLVAAEKARVAGANATVYQDAQSYCEARFPQGLSGSNRLPCIRDYIDSHPAPIEQPIPDALYKFDFVAPLWSPDLAGWSLVATGVLLLLLIIRIVAEIWLKSQIDS